jgi:hypothetical protein
MRLEQVVIDGVYLPPFLALLALTALVYFLLRLLLRRLALYRLFWHPALAGAAVFLILLSVIMLLFGP